MSDLWCKNCGALKFNDGHRCPPIWLWWCLDDGERAGDARTVHANEAESAAQAAAQWDHSHGAYEASWPRRYAVQSKTGDDRKVRIFDVELEYNPDFRADHARRCSGCRRLAEADSRQCRTCRAAWIREQAAALQRSRPTAGGDGGE